MPQRLKSTMASKKHRTPATTKGDSDKPASGVLQRILISGAGGQGIVLLGKLIAGVAMQTVRHVTFFPAYGVEVRGGASHCQVILSSDEIASPCAEQADVLILMNQNGAADFLRQLAPGGLALINSSLCRVNTRPRSGCKLISAPVSALADQSGNPRTANLVMLGLLLQHKPIFETTAVEKAIRESFTAERKDLLTVNLRAFNAGLQYKA